MTSELKFNFGNMSLRTIHSDDIKDRKRPRQNATDARSEKNVPFIEEDAFSDIVLVVEGKRLYTARSLLSMSSPVLTRLLQSPEFKEKREIPLTGKKYEHILELLYILHPAYQRKLSDQSIFVILSLAEEYQIWNLKQKCEESLLLCLNNEKSQNEDLLLKCLNASDEFKLFALWTKCLQIISKPSSSITSLQRSSGYENLSRFLKSMLEAFKGTTREDISKPATHQSLSSGRRDSTHFVNETNLKKAYSTSFTQTKS
ncbi:BTB and MATH domain-containing protein 36-like [Mytilus galloprovincialis]|uniref:BTB and MATH domain-containing protein 36-like n=1 Tax=Mytilus galloprovincialis TaxID=29158 RepID=UPI003F7C228B